MHQVMMENPEFLAPNNDEGLKRVLEWKPDRKYAYLMESSTLEYFTERNCSVARVGDLIDERAYAIGMRKRNGFIYFWSNKCEKTFNKLENFVQ